MANHWSDEETAIVLANQGDLSSEAIVQLHAKLPGRTLYAIKRQAWKLTLTADERAALKGHNRERYKENYGESTHTVSPTIVPDDVIEQWERRMLAEARRSSISKILGDPPPGYSALDLRQPQAA